MGFPGGFVDADSAGQAEHRLAAILSTDAAGYSRLMADDEDATVRALEASREIIAERVEQHGGRVVDAPGDNLLAEFPAASEALRAALEIQASLAERNASLPASRRMDFRIGVHLGEVRAEGERIYGDGVNIAARLERLAEPGGICVSGAVHEQVQRRVDAAFGDLGPQSLRNIPEPVRAFRVDPAGSAARPTRAVWRGLRRVTLVLGAGSLLLAALTWLSWPAPLGWLLDRAGLGADLGSPALPDRPSLVVLPFADLRGDPVDENLADGLAVDLATDLARNPLLFVIGGGSALAYADRDVGIEQIGRELGVRYVVEGSVRRAGARVRVTAQMTDATTGVQVWGERWERESEDLFALESELASEILAALQIGFEQAEWERMRRRAPASLTVHEMVIRARGLLMRNRRDSAAEARRLMERAVEIDPRSAYALAILGVSHLVPYMSRWTTERAALERSDELALRALELDPRVPAAHIVRASVAMEDGDVSAGLAHAERALAVAPSLDVAHMTLSVARLAAGQPLEALRTAREARRLNPHAPMISTILGLIQYRAGRPRQAAQILEREREANPDNIIARAYLASMRVGEGRLDDARELVREILAINPELTTANVLASSGIQTAPRGLAANLAHAGLPVGRDDS